VDKYGRFKIENMPNSPNPNPEERIQELKQRIASLLDRDHFTEDRDEDEYNCSNSSLCSTCESGLGHCLGGHIRVDKAELRELTSRNELLRKCVRHPSDADGKRTLEIKRDSLYLKYILHIKYV
jgi:hypothetical protein